MVKLNLMSYIVVDVESDGPAPGIYSMVCFGAVVVDEGLTKTFYGKVKPISKKWIPEALNVSGFTREQHLGFDDPLVVMSNFKEWIQKNSNGRPTFVSDNVAFDWQFINFYLWSYTNSNPFGHSGRRIGDIWSGMMMDAGKSSEWKKMFRKTVHDHNPVNDAKGNAEAMLAFQKRGLKIRF